MIKLIILCVSFFLLMCFAARWIHLHGWKYRSGVKMGKEVLDLSFWFSIISFIVAIIAGYTMYN